MLEILIAKVFSARNLAHLAHWKSKSYAQHQALGSFYEDVVGQLDALVECYQGKFGLIKIPELPAVLNNRDIVNVLESDAEWMLANHDKICREVSPIGNLLDTLIETYFSTIYKLKNLS